MEHFGLAEPGHSIHHVAGLAATATGFIGPFTGWLVGAVGSGLFGVLLGAVIVALLHLRPGAH
jgi:predicted DNA repair protein MutK